VSSVTTISSNKKIAASQFLKFAGSSGQTIYVFMVSGTARVSVGTKFVNAIELEGTAATNLLVIASADANLTLADLKAQQGLISKGTIRSSSGVDNEVLAPGAHV